MIGGTDVSEAAALLVEADANAADARERVVAELIEDLEVGEELAAVELIFRIEDEDAEVPEDRGVVDGTKDEEETVDTVSDVEVVVLIIFRNDEVALELPDMYDDAAAIECVEAETVTKVGCVEEANCEEVERIVAVDKDDSCTIAVDLGEVEEVINGAELLGRSVVFVVRFVSNTWVKRLASEVIPVGDISVVGGRITGRSVGLVTSLYARGTRDCKSAPESTSLAPEPTSLIGISSCPPGPKVTCTSSSLTAISTPGSGGMPASIRM